MSDSPGLVDLAIGLVNSVINLYDGQARAQNNRQQVTGPDDRPNIFLSGQTLILASQIMNTIMLFFAYGILNYAGNRSL